MRFVIAAAAVLLCAGTAAAQTPPPAPAAPSTCGDFLPKPTLPDGATATAAQMTSGNQAYEAWASDTRTKLTCRQAEVRQLAAQVSAAEASYNARASELNSFITDWQTQTTAYNGRHGANARSRGGLMVHQ